MAKKKTERSEVERMKSCLDGDLKKLQQYFHTIPNYRFNVGDRVEIGHLEYNHILEVYEDGRFYKVLTTTPIVKYGKYEGEEFRIWYVPGNRMLPYRTKEEMLSPPSFLENQDIQFRYYNTMIDSLISQFYDPGIDTEPDYQRDFVWTMEQKVALIDSIFKNIEIGKFTIIKRPFSVSEKAYEMLDGKQRLLTLIEFTEDRFTYNGYKFSELNSKDQNHLLNYSVSHGETDPLTDEQKYRYFLILNTAGTPMSKDQLKKVEEMYKKSKK